MTEKPSFPPRCINTAIDTRRIVKDADINFTAFSSCIEHFAHLIATNKINIFTFEHTKTDLTA